MKRILIADDDTVMLRLLEWNLRKEGFITTFCRDGPSVVIKVKDRLPDLAIIDLMLPGKSGLELIRDFKADPDLKGLPVIVVTGQGKGSTREELLAAGAASVFTKPFSPASLIARVNELLAL